MIIVDTSETKSVSRLPKIKGAITSPILESTTGADVMVSPLSFPAGTPLLIKRHIIAGAILVQFKYLSDLTHSIIDERINTALARMIACGAKHQYQRVIMGVGFYIPDKRDGKVLTGKVMTQRDSKVSMRWRRQEPVIDYAALATVRRRIAMRGGTFLNLTCLEEVPSELAGMERDVKFLAKKPVKELLGIDASFPPDPPEPDDPLQVPVEVKDGRCVLAAIKGIGPVKANALWNAIGEWNKQNRPLNRGFVEENWEPTLLQLLSWASFYDPSSLEIPKVSGWGKGTRRKVREQLGLEDGFDLHCRQTVIIKETDK
jgi:hypothetical protein